MITEKNNVFYCDCGFSWQRGMSGSHNCEDGLRAKLTDMAVQLANAESKCRELAAENAVLKDGVTYFACGSEYGFDLFSDKQAAINTAQEEIELHRESYLDGSGSWGEGVERAAWGIVIQSAQRVSTDGYQVSGSPLAEQACDYRLEYEVKTPVTDAFLAEVRAQGVELFAIEWGGHDSPYGQDAYNFAAQLRKGAAL
ncbi:hypothetical protein CKC86_03435 [Salmonella enterica]|nr:hypothetical protein [Salmonella enterica]EIT0299279.1 hypothetical protein [Salmonella enterica]